MWVPITINLPLGLAKQWTPANCAPMSLLCGPFAIIFLAQTANTVLVPVLPFLVKDVGAGAVEYGILQSTLWTSQTILAPVLGWLSDKIGRKPVIRLSLVISAIGNALLAISFSVKFMFVARIVSGLGFQIALFRGAARACPPPSSSTDAPPPPHPSPSASHPPAPPALQPTLPTRPPRRTAPASLASSASCRASRSLEGRRSAEPSRRSAASGCRRGWRRA